jgi:hypothetical protein
MELAFRSLLRGGDAQAPMTLPSNRPGHDELATAQPGSIIGVGSINACVMLRVYRFYRF